MKIINFIGSQAKLLSAVVLAAAIGGAATAVVSASIPDSGGTIHGCYVTKNGNLKVIDTNAGQSCTNKETALNWSAGGGNSVAGIAYVNFDFNTGHTTLDSTRSSDVTNFVDAGNGVGCLTFSKTPNFYVSSGVDTATPAQAAIKNANGWTDDNPSLGGPSTDDTLCDTAAPGSNAYIVPGATSTGIGYMAIF